MRKEFGKWLMDIAKYIATAVVISPFFDSIQGETVAYVTGCTVIVFVLVTGLYFQKEKETVKKKRRKQL